MNKADSVDEMVENLNLRNMPRACGTCVTQYMVPKDMLNDIGMMKARDEDILLGGKSVYVGKDGRVYCNRIHYLIPLEC